MRMTCDIRNIDEEMLDDTIIESSGDSVRSNLYPSYSSTSRIVTSASSSLRNILRVCSHCGTSKTPLWRSGPRGPKSLCNACGIRLKKAGRHSKADLRKASVPSPGKSPKASSRHVTLRHMRHISKKSKFCIDNDAEESSEMENVSYSTMPHTVIPHYASRHHAEHSDVTHLNSLLAKFHKKKNLARGIRLCNAVPRDEAEGAISLMALSSGC